MATAPITSTASNNGVASINVDSFLKIVLAQLTYQDPLKPVDSAQFITQLAQITSLEQSRQLTDKVDSLLSVQASSQLIGLLGKSVEVGGQASTTTTVGQVTDITFKSGVPSFTIKTAAGTVMTDITSDQIVRVSVP